MITKRSRSILEFLYASVEEGMESLREARRFVGQMDGLSGIERLFLECALVSRANMRAFHAALG